jgi:hypothetical protein
LRCRGALHDCVSRFAVKQTGKSCRQDFPPRPGRAIRTTPDGVATNAHLSARSISESGPVHNPPPPGVNSPVTPPPPPGLQPTNSNHVVFSGVESTVQQWTYLLVTAPPPTRHCTLPPT